ncbi:MAG TPA: phosphotransferase [Streptosporangiaceae bacterium]|nr:phosphotransferase [Streptosporangiaceae bacterium]
MITAGRVEEALNAWPCRVESVTLLAGGWNSATWLVVTTEGRYVAKLVDNLDAPALLSGLRVAEYLAVRGLACGAPARTLDGELVIVRPEGTLALLQHEPGSPPDLSVPDEVRRAGRVLARTHQVLRDFPASGDSRYAWPWEWVTRCLDTIPMPEHVNAAARRVWPEIVSTVDRHDLSISVIHADPGPDGFLLGADGGAQDALIDWATTLRGPLLYDLACFAVITKPAGPRVARWFTEGYAAHMPEIGPQLSHLDWLVKARWLANAIYFSSRIERGITHGSDSPTANKDGLAAAYAGMTA